MSFAVFTVNWWAVLVAGVAYFIVGAIWYMALANPWMKGIGKTRDQIQSKTTDYIVSLISELIVAYALAVALNAFGITNVLDAIFVAAVMWFGFSLLPTIVHYAYEGRTFGLLAINKGYDLVAFIVAAIILSLWR